MRNTKGLDGAIDFLDELRVTFDRHEEFSKMLLWYLYGTECGHPLGGGWFCWS
jgi:hypothetical protein